MTINNQDTIAHFENHVLTIQAGDLESTLAVKDIEYNWNNLSHYPERRARIELQGLEDRINTMAAHIQEVAQQSDIWMLKRK